MDSVLNKSSLKRRNRDKERSILKDNIPMMVMLAPFMIFFTAFMLIPIISSIALSFTSYDLISSAKFIGIDNYRRMLVNDDTFAIGCILKKWTSVLE